MKIVINRCFGGFGLSPLAFKRLIEKGWNDSRIHLNSYGEYRFADFTGEGEARTDPDVIAVVEELGEKSWGSSAELKIISIPDDVEWFIDDYDGKECVREKHRTWA